MRKHGKITNKTLCECGSGLPVRVVKLGKNGAIRASCEDCMDKDPPIHESSSNNLDN